MRISAKFELVSVYKDLHSDQYDTGYLQIQVVRGSETIVITASTITANTKHGETTSELASYEFRSFSMIT